MTTHPTVKKLRENATDAERKLWHHLRRKQVNDLRFRRQYRLGAYIVDFVCLPARLVIEVDGGQHDTQGARDGVRTAWLTSQGFRVIRFWNNEVLGSIEGVLHVVGEQLALATPPPPAPSREGRGGESVILRQARLDDADAICDLYLASRRAALPYLRKVHSDAETRQWIAEVLLRDCAVWVAEADGCILGFAAVAGTHLEQLYLHPGHLRRGIGSLLLAKAKELSPGGLELHCFQRNAAARAFYEARGFTAVEFGDGSGNEEGEPDIRYSFSSAGGS